MFNFFMGMIIGIVFGCFLMTSVLMIVIKVAENRHKFDSKVDGVDDTKEMLQ